MSVSVPISPRIIEALYAEALVLSDEVRHAFTPGAQPADPARVARSSEGLRTTTRMLHAIAWLLNHRACFRGELEQAQLRRHPPLSLEVRHVDASHLALLDGETAHLVETTRNFYDRLLRLDRAWRLTGPAAPNALQHLRARIEDRLAG